LPYGGRVGTHWAADGKELIAVENISVKKSGTKLTLTIELSAPGRLSSTGNSTLVASSGGWKAVPGTDLRLNAMVMRPREDGDES
jgi:hypothetical protein